MDYYPLGNLGEQHQSKPFDRKEVLFIVLQGLEALEYIHGRNLIHRDLKPENILMETRDPIKIRIADFGLGMNLRESLQEFAGTHYYAAPEIYRLPRVYTRAVDVWSLGMIGYHFTVNIDYRLPFEPLAWFMKLSRSLRQHDDNPVIKYLFANAMLVFDHKTRYSAEDAINLVVDSFYEVWPPSSDEGSTASSDALVLQLDEPADDGAASHEIVELQAGEAQPQWHFPSTEALEWETPGPFENAAASNDATDPQTEDRTSTKRKRMRSLTAEGDTEKASDAEPDRTSRPRKVPRRRTSI